MVDVELEDLAHLGIRGREGEGQVAGRSDAPFVAEVEHGAAGESTDGVSLFLGGGHGLDDDQQLVAVRLFGVLEHGHDALLAVDLEVEVEVGDAVVLEVVLHAILDAADDVVDLGDHDRILDAGARDGAIAYAAHAFELDEELVRGDELRSGHLHLVVVHLREGALVQVEGATGARQYVRIGLFVERMGGDGERGALAQGREGLEHKVILAEVAEHAVATAAGQGGDGGTLEDLAHVERQGLVVALLDGEGSEDGGVVRATGDDHVRAFVQGFDVRLFADLSDDVDGLVDVFFGDLFGRVQGRHLALAELLLNELFVQLGGDDGHLEAELLLAGDLLDDVHGPVQMRGSTAAASRADDDGDAGLDGGGDHNL